MMEDGHSYLEMWNFQELKLSTGQALSTMSICLRTLLSQVHCALNYFPKIIKVLCGLLLVHVCSRINKVGEYCVADKETIQDRR